MTSESAIKGFIIRRSEIPDAFIATSSYCSPRFPKVISDDKRMANGSASGTKVEEA